jgi:hypothetical protein
MLDAAWNNNSRIAESSSLFGNHDYQKHRWHDVVEGLLLSASSPLTLCHGDDDPGPTETVRQEAAKPGDAARPTAIVRVARGHRFVKGVVAPEVGNDLYGDPS